MQQLSLKFDQKGQRGRLIGIYIGWPMMSLTYENMDRPVYYVIKDPEKQKEAEKMARDWMGYPHERPDTL